MWPGLIVIRIFVVLEQWSLLFLIWLAAEFYNMNLHMAHMLSSKGATMEYFFIKKFWADSS